MIIITHLSKIVSPQTIVACQQITCKLIEFAKTYFLFISNLCLVGLGFRDYITVAVGEKPNFPSVKEIFKNICSGIASGEFKLIQGSCFVASGLCGALSFYYPSFFLDLGANGLFLIGNLVALKSNIELYLHGSRMAASNEMLIREKGKVLMHSAIMGMINNINYIMIPLITAFGGPVAAAIFFGCIAVTTGCIKILYDYMYLRNTTAVSDSG